MILFFPQQNLKTMSHERNRKLILDSFEKRVCEGYLDHCKMHQLPEDVNGLITYIIDQDLIPPQTIQKYTLQKEFKDQFSGDRGQKTHMVENLAHKFNLSTRTVWNILKGDSK